MPKRKDKGSPTLEEVEKSRRFWDGKTGGKLYSCVLAHATTSRGAYEVELRVYRDTEPQAYTRGVFVRPDEATGELLECSRATETYLEDVAAVADCWATARAALTPEFLAKVQDEVEIAAQKPRPPRVADPNKSVLLKVYGAPIVDGPNVYGVENVRRGDAIFIRQTMKTGKNRAPARLFSIDAARALVARLVEAIDAAEAEATPEGMVLQ